MVYMAYKDLYQMSNTEVRPFPRWCGREGRRAAVLGAGGSSLPGWQGGCPGAGRAPTPGAAGGRVWRPPRASAVASHRWHSGAALGARTRRCRCPRPPGQAAAGALPAP